MNTAREVVMRLLDQSGSLLVRSGEALSDEEFFAQPEYGASFAWTLGHLAAFQDWALSNVLPNQVRVLDSETREFFRGGRPIRSDSSHFRSRADMAELFTSTQARAMAALIDFDVARWGEPTPTRCRFPTVGGVWESMAYENYWHLGQLSASIPRFQGTSITVPVPRPYKLPYAP